NAGAGGRAYSDSGGKQAAGTGLQSSDRHRTCPSETYTSRGSSVCPARPCRGGAPSSRPAISRLLGGLPVGSLFTPDPHRLHIDELADPELTQLAAVPRFLDPAEREPRIGGHHVIDEDLPRFDPGDEEVAVRPVVRPD